MPVMFRSALLFLLSTIIPYAVAELYVTVPDSTTTCAAGKSCTVSWLDNGVAPTVENIGACTVGLYHGKQQLVQMIEAVDVAASHSLTFTPQADAGPNSDTYYIALRSTTYKVNSTSDYVGFSSNFRLTDMSGSFDSPIPSLTSSVAVPTSLTSSANPVSVSTLSNTVTLSVSSATTTPTQTSSSSRMTTSLTGPVSTASSSGASPSTSASAAPASSASAQRPAFGLMSIFFLVALAFVAQA